MRNLIIYNNDNHLAEYYQSVIKGLYDIESSVLSDLSNFSNILMKQDVAIINYDDKSSSVLIRFCLENTPKIPCIITGDDNQIYRAKVEFKTHGLLEYFNHNESVEFLWQKINRFTNLHQRSLQKREYCKVNIQFFFSSKNVFCDIYLKVNENKFLKVFNRYDKIDIEDIRKYKEKKIDYLYVREKDFSLLMKNIVGQLKPILSSSPGALTTINSVLHSTIPIQLQETVSVSIQKLGLSGEAIEITNLAINSTLDIIQSNHELFKVFNDAIKGKHYISEHSFILAYLSCAILKEGPHAHPDNNLSLSVAAFFHDVFLEREEHAKIQSKNEQRFKTLGYKEKDEVTSHPQRASKLVSEINGIPTEVQTILLQHHENYEGTGFPFGIDYKRTHPLSAIFNLSHELTVYFFESGQSPENIRDIIEDLSNKYTKGNYKMALDAAIKVFEHELEMLALKEAQKKAV